MAGKTGTAQRVSRKGNVSTNPHLLPLHLRHQAWFIGYAPAQDPRIAVAVMVEHGGYGGSTAAPIARKLFDAWLLGEYAEPDPDAIPVTAIGVRAEAAEASPTPERAARAAIPGLDAATIEVIRAGPGAGQGTGCSHERHPALAPGPAAALRAPAGLVAVRGPVRADGDRAGGAVQRRRRQRHAAGVCPGSGLPGRAGGDG